MPDTITRRTLPPYLPELDPVETVRRYLRRNFLANRMLRDYDALPGVCCDAWNAFVVLPKTTRSMARVVSDPIISGRRLRRR